MSTTGPSGGAGTGPVTRITLALADLVLDTFVAIFKALPRRSR